MFFSFSVSLPQFFLMLNSVWWFTLVLSLCLSAPASPLANSVLCSCSIIIPDSVSCFTLSTRISPNAKLCFLRWGLWDNVRSRDLLHHKEHLTRGQWSTLPPVGQWRILPYFRATILLSVIGRIKQLKPVLCWNPLQTSNGFATTQIIMD